MGYVINNSTSYDLKQLEQLAREFLPFAQKRMGFDKSPTINFSSDEENSLNPLGKTAYYDPSQMAITIMVSRNAVPHLGWAVGYFRISSMVKGFPFSCAWTAICSAP